jgi:hypothetical protein
MEINLSSWSWFYFFSHTIIIFIIIREHDQHHMFLLSLRLINQTIVNHMTSVDGRRSCSIQKRKNTQTKDMKGRLKHGEKLM